MINKRIVKEFGERIRALRIKSEMSQEVLSDKTGFHRTYIGMIERGERNISLSNIAVFAKVFKMTVSELLKFDKRGLKHSHDSYEIKGER